MNSSDDRDERLATLIADLSDQARLGQSPNVETIAHAHPDLAEELRELWAIAQFAQLARNVPLASTIDHPSRNRIDSALETMLPKEFGDFELYEVLGRGGMGVVYRARQKSLNRIVALKMVREAHLASDADRARFAAEARAAASLQHPNIVTLYEVGQANEQAYLCMEYIAGPTLAQRLTQSGPLPSKDAARMLATVAKAVQHAHDQGILHRDLKPSNVLLAGINNNEPQPKVSDFGLAKQVNDAESITRTGAIVGTPSYMSPEQALGRRDVGVTADVYSLGAILYELLTGRPPFRALHPVDILLMVLEQEPIPPRRINPTIDRDVELVCMKCLQKPSELRYHSALALAHDLEAYLAGEEMSVEPGSLGSFVSRLLRETHHAAVLENWGLLWMWHSLMILLLCWLTQLIEWSEYGSYTVYLIVWSIGLLTWGSIFWRLRRRDGPVLFVERQIAHAWAGGVVASISLFVIEVIQQLPPLTLSPVLPIIAGMVFIFKAGTLSGRFYLSAMAHLATSVAMARFPQVGHLLFGVVSAITFFFPGLKYYRQRKRGDARELLG